MRCTFAVAASTALLALLCGCRRTQTTSIAAGGPAIIADPVGPGAGCADERAATAQSVLQRSGRAAGWPATVRLVQLLGLPWRPRRRRHGPEPARSGLALRQSRRSDLRLHRAWPLAGHAGVGHEDSGCANMGAGRLHQDPWARRRSRTRRSSPRTKRCRIRRRTRTGRWSRRRARGDARWFARHRATSLRSPAACC